jgi:hypothetical protein
LKLKYDESLSSVAFKFDLRRYTLVCTEDMMHEREAAMAALGSGLIIAHTLACTINAPP